MEYFISTDKTKLDKTAIHDFISISYWADGRSLEEVRSTIENSLCFGIYVKTGKQIGFARVVTDYTFFGNIMDFIVFKEYQGNGYGKILMDFMMNHEVVKNLRTISLKTQDAHGLYRKYGFKNIGDSPLWMTSDKQKLD